MKNLTLALVLGLAPMAAVGCADVDPQEQPAAEAESALTSDATLLAKIGAVAAETNYTTESDDTFHVVKATGFKKVTAKAVRAALATAGKDVTDHLGTSVAAAQVKVEDFDFTTPPEDGEDMEMARLTGTMSASLKGLKAYVVAKKVDPSGDHGAYLLVFIGRAPSGTMFVAYAKGVAT